MLKQHMEAVKCTPLFDAYLRFHLSINSTGGGVVLEGLFN